MLIDQPAIPETTPWENVFVLDADWLGERISRQ